MRVLYDPTDDISAVADAYIDEYYKNLLEGSKLGMPIVVIANESMIELFRIGLLDGDFDELTFVFEGEEIPVKPDGMIDRWPKGFGDLQMTQISRILDGKRKHYEVQAQDS